MRQLSACALVLRGSLQDSLILGPSKGSWYSVFTLN
jgi:hypothetical protein